MWKTERKVELLAPAGSMEALRAAVQNGCDAVYLGGSMFGARAFANNFDEDEIQEAIAYAHVYGVRVFVTVNTLIREEEFEDCVRYVQFLYEHDVDAVIIQDLGLFSVLRQRFPDLELHASTQMHIHNPQGIRFMESCGASRVVVPRETPLKEIRAYTALGVDLEVFVQGALCVSYSGQCLMSSLTLQRSGNRGECAQPCRWKYYLVEENRPGQYMPIGENEDGSYILNANDLCTAPFLDLICKAGVDSLKIEGRAKTFYYVASVTAAYRKALDQYLANPASDTFDLPDSVLDELNRTSHRHYSPGFYFGKEKALQTPSHTYVRDWDFIGTVDSWEDGVAHCTQRSKFCLGDSLEILQPDGSVVPVTPEWIKNAEGETVDATPHPMMQYTIPCATPLMPYSLLRMQKRQ